MDRRKFLAFMPTISAIPFVGTDFIETENGILLKDPNKAEMVKEIPDFDFNKVELHLVQEGFTIGKAILTNVNIESSHYGNQSATIEAQIRGQLLNI